MEQRIKALREQMEQKIGQIDTKEKLAAFWQEFLGKKGAIADLMKGLGAVAKEDRPAMGKVINDFKVLAEEKYQALSAKMDELTPGPNLLAVARAGAGVNNIPHAEYAKKGIVVFNTPGANANGVKELVIAAMLLASRDIVGGIEWVKENASDPAIGKAAEKAKKAGCAEAILYRPGGRVTECAPRRPRRPSPARRSRARSSA